MTDEDCSFESLLHYLKQTRGFDFTGYKRTSLVRRVRRRMQTVPISSYEDYQDYLEAHPAEFVALFNTILINVTSFFRDPEAWARLAAELLPELLRHKPEGPLRVWSAGCASGEEAYSLAIVLAELLGPEDFRRRVTIYATDVDEEALAQARRASYEPGQLRGVSPARLAAYFEPTGRRYSFHRDLRRSVILGRNDLVQDAPISHLDLLVCRNALMYFNAETQRRILRRLNAALCPAGILFVGAAELLLGHDDLFVPVDRGRRFFRPVTGDAPQPLPPPLRTDGDEVDRVIIMMVEPAGGSGDDGRRAVWRVDAEAVD
jgi:two-component system, chemotaxis family, CheB/CheR fusion protein